VNGVERDVVISKMSQNPKQCDLLVVTNFKSYMESNSKLKQISEQRRQRSSTLNPNLAMSTAQFDAATSSRTCCLVAKKGSKSFGYSLTPNTPQGPHRVHQVAQDSPAYNAGLKVDDLLLKLNDVDLTGKSYTNVIEMLKVAAETGKYQLEVIEGKGIMNGNGGGGGGGVGRGLRNRSMSFNSLNTNELKSKNCFFFYIFKVNNSFLSDHSFICVIGPLSLSNGPMVVQITIMRRTYNGYYREERL
jgi:hypothetical protein